METKVKDSFKGKRGRGRHEKTVTASSSGHDALNPALALHSLAVRESGRAWRGRRGRQVKRVMARQKAEETEETEDGGRRSENG